FHHPDWLGTERAGSTYAGGLDHSCSSLPFGDSFSCVAADPSILHLTGQERDFESGLDYFNARHYSSNQGRFLSPDPAGFLAQKPDDPQSWDLYTYTRNNPLTFLDPSGLDCIYVDPDASSGADVDHGGTSDDCDDGGGTWVPGFVDDGWMTFNSGTGLFQVGSMDDATGIVNYFNFAAGAETDSSGDCLIGCDGFVFSSAGADWFQAQLVGNSEANGMFGYMQFLITRKEPLGGGVANQIFSGPLAFWTDNWAGPGGMGPPGGQGDWAASVHDYNFRTNGISIGAYFNPGLSPEAEQALIQSNQMLINNSGGFQALKMGIFFGIVNAFQWLTHVGR